MGFTFRIWFALAFLPLTLPLKAQQSAQLNFDFQEPIISILDIEPKSNNSISLQFTSVGEAGLGITKTATDNSLWLNYTNSKLAGGNVKKINVQVSSQLPRGIILEVEASSVSHPCGKGNLGTPTSVLTLATFAQTLITGIGGCYTGNGIGCGHQLTYSLKINNTNFSELNSGNTTLQVTYTFSD